MKKFDFCLIAVCSVIFSALPVLAQDAALVQAARKEGKVVWYTSLALPSSTAISHYFQQKYKGVEVEVHRTGSQRVLQRVMSEHCLDFTAETLFVEFERRLALAVEKEI